MLEAMQTDSLWPSSGGSEPFLEATKLMMKQPTDASDVKDMDTCYVKRAVAWGCDMSSSNEPSCPLQVASTH